MFIYFISNEYFSIENLMIDSSKRYQKFISEGCFIDYEGSNFG